MTTAPKYPPVSVGVVPGNSSDAEPPGAIRLRLDALGIDFRAADFPTQFIDFCEENDDYEMEINEAGELVILPMVGFRGNRQETELSAELTIFRRVSGGVNISQTSRFRLSTGAIRGPDAAWITRERYDAATDEERETVFPGAPDFVVEIRSRWDNLAPLQRKMQIWMDGGARLGWLIDPRNRRVYIYRADQPEPEILEDPETLDGEDVLHGFSFGVREHIFDLQ
jgi:Uma2 family endonuclease